VAVGVHAHFLQLAPGRSAQPHRPRVRAARQVDRVHHLVPHLVVPARRCALRQRLRILNPGRQAHVLRTRVLQVPSPVLPLVVVVLFSYSVAHAFMTVRLLYSLADHNLECAYELSCCYAADLRDVDQHAAHVLHARREPARRAGQLGARVGAAHPVGERPLAAQVANGFVAPSQDFIFARVAYISPSRRVRLRWQSSISRHNVNAARFSDLKRDMASPAPRSDGPTQPHFRARLSCFLQAKRATPASQTFGVLPGRRSRSAASPAEQSAAAPPIRSPRPKQPGPVAVAFNLAALAVSSATAAISATAKGIQFSHWRN
jgi:hypothetical protein